MVQTRVTLPPAESVGNALRGVPLAPERHGGRSLQCYPNGKQIEPCLELTGIGVVDGETKNGSVHTDTFVLEMTYDPLAVRAMTGLSELAAAQAGLIQLDSLDSTDDQWAPAAPGTSAAAMMTSLALSRGMATPRWAIGAWTSRRIRCGPCSIIIASLPSFPNPPPLPCCAGAMGLIGFAWWRMAVETDRLDGGARLGAETVGALPDSGAIRLTRSQRRRRGRLLEGRIRIGLGTFVPAHRLNALSFLDPRQLAGLVNQSCYP